MSKSQFVSFVPETRSTTTSTHVTSKMMSSPHFCGTIMWPVEFWLLNFISCVFRSFFDKLHTNVRCWFCIKSRRLGFEIKNTPSTVVRIIWISGRLLLQFFMNKYTSWNSNEIIEHFKIAILKVINAEFSSNCDLIMIYFYWFPGMWLVMSVMVTWPGSIINMRKYSFISDSFWGVLENNL
jgi:hypothetical protein